MGNKTGIQLISEEREKQINKHGYDSDHDEGYAAFQISSFAACFIANALNADFKKHTHYDGFGNIARFQIREHETKKWILGNPWPNSNIEKHSTIESLVTAGALIAAEIDRLNKL